MNSLEFSQIIFNLFFNSSDEIRNEIKALKKEYKDEKKSNEKVIPEPEAKETEHDNDMVQSYISEQRKYSSMLKDLPKKGDARFVYSEFSLMRPP